MSYPQLLKLRRFLEQQFLADWITVVFLIIFYLFYINRAIGYAVTKLLNLFLWRFYRTYISVESLSISLLSGRVEFKNLIIISQDSTVSIIRGCWNWRFWLLHPTVPTIFKSGEGYSEEEFKKNSRNFLSLEGLEIFVYNRSIAYMNVIQEYFSQEEKLELKEQFPELYECFFNWEAEQTFEQTRKSKDKAVVPYEEGLNSLSRLSRWLLKWLPMIINVKLGALVLGSISTPSVLVFHWNKSETIIDALKPENHLDKLKIKISTQHTTSKILLKPNPLYERDQQSFKRNFYKNVLKQMKDASVFLSRSLKRSHKSFGDTENMQSWTGLPMYTDIETDSTNFLEDDAHLLLSHQNEYAKFSKILHCEKIVHVYSFDIAGSVPQVKLATSTEFQGPEIGNGGLPPEHRLDIQFFEAHVAYGPWANRQIAPIIRMLSPQITREHKKHSLLQPGDTREATRFQLFIDICSKSTVRLPTREFSKDDAFLESYSKSKVTQRPFGWIDIILNEGSSMFFDFTFFPMHDTFINNFNIDFMKPSIFTSVNHEIFFKADYHNLTSQSMSPLKWNEAVIWNFSQISNNSEVFLLREHVTLLLDLFQDFSFSMDEVSLYELYRANDYKLNWRFKNSYEIHVNVNDANVINVATDFNENNYITFRGEESVINVSTLLDNIASLSTTIFFDIDTPLFKIMLSTPTWSTIHNFVDDDEVGRCQNFLLNGSYQFFRNVDIGNVDQLIMECDTDGTSLLLYGFVIKYFDNLRTNIVGRFKQYRTSEEFQQELQTSPTGSTENENISLDLKNIASIEDTIDSSYTKISKGEVDEKSNIITKSQLRRKSNETDIWITFNVQNGAILLPEYLYNSRDCLGIHFSTLSIDLRALDFYMDMKIDALPIYLKKHQFSKEFQIFDSLEKTSFEEILVNNDGSLSYLSIHGHKLFGLPPSFDTYISKWNFSFGQFSIDSDVAFIKTAHQAICKVVYSSSDVENTLVYDLPSTESFEFNTFELEGVSIKVHEGDTCINATATNILMSVVTPDTTELSDKFDFAVEEFSLNIKTDSLDILNFNIKMRYTKFETPSNFDEEFIKRREFILQQDAPYHRCWFLLPRELKMALGYNDLIGSVPPTTSLPLLPTPLTPMTADFIIENFLKTDNYLYDYMLNDGDDTEFSAENKLHNLENVICAKPGTNTGREDVNSSTVDIMKLHTSFDIAGIGIIIKLFDVFTFLSCDNIADSIQMDVVSPLSSISKIKSENSKFNVNTSGMSIEIKNSDYDTDVNILFTIVKLQYLNEDKRIFDAAYGKWTFDHTVKTLFNLNGMVGTLSKLGTGLAAGPSRSCQLHVDVCEYLHDKDEFALSNLNVGSIKFKFNSASHELLVNMVTKSILKFQNEFGYFKKISERWKSQKREFILQALKASVKYDINYDPPVITKLSNIVRLSKTHVRDNASWRLSMRIRHIIESLPQEWKVKMTEQLAANKFTPLVTASDEFITTFKKWKNIEQRESYDTYLYHKTFLGSSPLKPFRPNISRQLFFSIDKVLIINTLLDPLIDDAIYLKSIDIKYSDYFEEKFKTSNSKSDNALAFGNLSNFLVSKVEYVGINIGLPTLQVMKLVFELLSGLSISPSNDKSQNSLKSSFLLNQSLFLIDTFYLSFNYNFKSLNFKLFKNSCSLFISPSSISLVHAFSHSSIYMKFHSSIFMRNNFNKGTFHFTSINDSKNKKCNQVGLIIEDVVFEAKEHVTRSLHIAESIIASFKEVLENFNIQNCMKSDYSNSSLCKTWDINIQMKTLHSTLNLLSPLSFEFDIRSFDMSGKFGYQSNNDILVSFENMNTIVSSNKHLLPYLYSSQSKFCLSLSPSEKTNSLQLYIVEISTGLLKYTLTDLRTIGKPLSEDIVSAENTISLIRSFLIKNAFLDPTSDLGFLFDVSLKLDYVGLLVDFKAYQLVLEFHELYAGGKNYIQENEQMSQISDFLWYMSTQSTSLSIKDPLISVEYSKILDFTIAISIFRDIVDELSNLEIKSDFCRVCLIPQSFIRVLWMYEQFFKFGEEFSQAAEKTKTFKDINNITELPHQEASAKFTNRFKNVQCLVYDFCFGWMYGEQVDAYASENTTDSGVILGFQKLFSAHNMNFGKLTICNSYVSVSSGTSHSDFYESSMNTLLFNKVYLPNIQVAYWLTKNNIGTHDLNLKMSGDLLQIDLLDNVVKVFQRIAASFLRVQKLKAFILKGFNKKAIKPSLVTDSDHPFKKYGIKQVNCTVNYAGGHCRIYSVHDILKSTDPTVNLTSPEMKISFKYIHEAESSFAHILRVCVLVGDATNALYPGSVEIFHQMLKDFQNLLMIFGPSSAKTEVMSPSSAKVDYQKLLSRFDIAFDLEFGNQCLNMICEPKAKIKAVLALDSISLKAFTSVNDPSLSFSVSLTVTGLISKFQHIFSKNVSSSLSISLLNTVFLVSHTDRMEVYGITKSSRLNMFLDLNQFEDLMLFFDIWTPNSVISTAAENLTPTLPTKFHEKPKRIATSSAFMWNYILVFEDTGGKFDLGPSLGVLTISSTRISAFANQFFDWRKKLSFEVQSLVITSEGRLSGFINLQNFNWRSEVLWERREKFNLTPLVNLSFGFESLRTKLSLDYHIFLISHISSTNLNVYNTQDQAGSIQGLLAAKLDCDKIEFFSTVLATSNILNIYDTICRIWLDNKVSYFETLRDSNTKTIVEKLIDHDLENYMNSLKTKLSVNFGELYVQIFEHTLTDTEMLVIRNEGTKARMSTKGKQKIVTQLDMFTSMLTVETSTNQDFLKEHELNSINISEYIDSARKATGGMLASFPSINIQMNTWQSVDSNKIELLYSSEFGGMVRIKWNLRPVNFIRELWRSHALTLSQRRDELMAANEEEKKENIGGASFFEEQNLENKIKTVNLGDKYEYLPLVEPHIETPQIKDLGGATPPLEWFGLNRNRFPGMVHQVIIVPLQHVIAQSEKEYGKALNNL